MFFYIRKVKYIYTLFFVSFLSFAEAESVKYTVVKDDTLWALANLYLRDPFLWPQIEREDGLSIGDPKLLQIGTLLVIKKNIASAKALDVLPDFLSKKENFEGIKSDSSHSFEVEPKKFEQYHFYLIKEGLVYAYYRGQHVTIPVEYLKPKPIKVKSLGKNIHIDQKLFDSIFKKDIQ